MSKNLKVIDSKPANSMVLDVQPKNSQLNTDFGQEQFYTVIIAKGQYMGIPPFTYPEAGTVSSSFSP